jgi:hypothetical protein
MRVVRKHRPSTTRNCAACGGEFRVLACRIDNNPRYCGMSCKKDDTKARRKAHLTYERLIEMLAYDQETGVFTWRRSPKNRASVIKPGQIAGKTTEKGYRKILIDGRNYFSHRLAWFYVHKKWPPDQIDHRSKAKGNNAIDNIRLATQQQNQWNTGPRRTSKTGVKGVCFLRGRIVAQIRRNGRCVYLGTFDSIGEAGDAYAKAASEIHGEFIDAMIRNETTAQVAL